MQNFQPIYNNSPEAIMHIDGIKCKISIEVEYDEMGGMPLSAKVEINKTEEPLSVSDTIKGKYGPQVNILSYYKWGGYPRFIQNEVCPMSEDGRLYRYLCTINNNWGDMGNGNVFALIKPSEKGFDVEDVYVEASCS